MPALQKKEHCNAKLHSSIICQCYWGISLHTHCMGKFSLFLLQVINWLGYPIELEVRCNKVPVSTKVSVQWSTDYFICMPYFRANPTYEYFFIQGWYIKSSSWSIMVLDFTSHWPSYWSCTSRYTSWFLRMNWHARE